MPDPVSQGTPPAPVTGTPTGVDLGTPTTGTPTPTTGTPTGSDPAGSGGAKPWYDGLVKDPDNLKAITTKKWDSPEALVKSYRELETAFSQKSAVSQAPSDPKDYAFNIPKELQAGYNAPFADAFRTAAHKAGLSKEQAAAVHDGVLAFAQENLQAQATGSREALSQQVVKAQAALEKSWGGSITPEFARNLEMAKRAIGNLDPNLRQELVDVGAIVVDGGRELIAKPAIFAALSKAGAALFAEDTLFGRASQTSNPFDAKTEDMKMQGHIVKTDPARARLLIAAAGLQNAPHWRHMFPA